jgi:hypothetical protein
MCRAFLIVALVLVAGTACGGSGDKAASDTTGSASEVEASVKAQLAKGGGGRVVDLGNDPPKLVTCRKDGGRWRCTVRTTNGRSMLCLVNEDNSGRKLPLTPVCGPMDN